MAQAIGATPLEVSLESDGHAPSVVVKGQVDGDNISNLISVLDKLAGEHEQCISLDMSEVESIDDSALEILAGSAGALSVKQRRLRLADASGTVSSLFNKHSISDAFCRENHCEHKCGSGSCHLAASTCQVDVFTLPSEYTYCREARDRVMQVAEASNFSKCKLADVKLAIGEAISNAVRHGHSGKPDSTFTISCIATTERVCVTVRDSGPGFRPEDIPSFEDALFMEHGRGVHCMNAVMDEVTFSFEGGTTVRLVKLG